MDNWTFIRPKYTLKTRTVLSLGRRSNFISKAFDALFIALQAQFGQQAIYNNQFMPLYLGRKNSVLLLSD